MSHQSFQTQFTSAPPVYGEDRSFDMGHNSIPLLYHHQPPSPNNSPSSSSASRPFGHHDVPMGPVSGIQGYSNVPYQPSHGQPSNMGQGTIGTSQGLQSCASVTLQFMPTQPLLSSHPSSLDTHVMPIDSMEYLKYPNDNPSFASSPAMPFNARHHRQESPQPTAQETEDYLRKSLSIPATHAVNLYSLPESTKAPKIPDMIKLAIWGSPKHKLTLRQIYEAIEDRYPHFKDAPDKPWQRSIRHNLSLKAMFVREERPQSDPGNGHYWTLNVRMGEGNKRSRKRRDQRDDVNIRDEDDDTDVSSESQGHPDTTPSQLTSLQRQQYFGNPPQGLMQGQPQYMAQSSHMIPFDQSGGSPFYNAPQNTPFHMGRIGPSLPPANASQWGPLPALNPQMGGMPHASAPGIPAYGLQYQTTTRYQQQTDHLPQTLAHMQGGLMVPMAEDDDDERARSGPRQRSSHRS